MRTRRLIILIACALLMSACGGRGVKKIVTDTIVDEITGINITDSLHVMQNAGPIETDVYSGLLPGADVPGIIYDLTLKHYQTLNNGVYELSTTYLKNKEGKNPVSTTQGRYNILTGFADHVNTEYISLIPFGNVEAESNFAIMPAGLILLGEDMTLPSSEQNYTLIKKTVVE